MCKVTLLVLNVGVKNVQTIDLCTHAVADSGCVLFLRRQLSSLGGRSARNKLNALQLTVQENLALSQSLINTHSNTT